MTDSLSDGALRFLDHDPVITAEEIRNGNVRVPSEPGVYGWWFDAKVLPHLSEGMLVKDGLRLLYVGIAPSGPPKAGGKPRTLRDRLYNHCRGPIATSTLRRTLVALLRSQEGFRIEKTGAGKLQMAAEDEARLTEWMSDHARVAWSTVPEPWLVEEELLKNGPRLPLNIKGSSDPFRLELKALRAKAQN